MEKSKLFYRKYCNSGLEKYWPIDFKDFTSKVFTEEKEIRIKILTEEEKGFCVLKIKYNIASLTVIAVDEKYQRNGIGKKLLSQVDSVCKEDNIRTLYVGHKVGDYLWPSVPFEPNCVDFFLNNGFQKYSEEPCEDMVLDISEYIPDNNITGKIKDMGYSITLASKEDIDKLLEFENKEFPEWVKFFVDRIKNNKLEDIVLVKNNLGDVVGSTTLSVGNYCFSKLFDGNVGFAGVVGIKESLRGKGLGSAMYVKSTQILKERGVKYSLVLYTDVADFYRRLGYKSWRKYHMLKKEY